MPAGDPAGYLPSVRRTRKRKGQPTYQPRARRAPSSTGGAMAPPSMKPNLTGGTEAPPSMSHRRSMSPKIIKGYRPRSKRGKTRTLF